MRENINVGYLPASKLRKVDQSFIDFQKKRGDKKLKEIGDTIQPSLGTDLIQKDFKTLILETSDPTKYNPQEKKENDGLYVRYASNVLGRYCPERENIAEKSKVNEFATSKLVFIDIDDITKEEVDNVFAIADELFKQFSFVMGMQKSTSYYLKKDKAGLHIFCRVNEYNLSYCPVYSVMLSAIVFDWISSKVKLSNNAWDPALHSFWQRFFIHYGEVRWNDDYTIWDGKVDINEKERLMKKYKEFFNNVSGFDMSGGEDNDDSEDIDITKVKQRTYTTPLEAKLKDGEVLKMPGDVIFMDHKERFMIAAALKSRLGVDFATFKEFFSHIMSKSENSTVSDCHLLYQYWNQKDNVDERYQAIGLSKLRRRGWLVEMTTGCDMKSNEYLAKYEDEIVDFIKTHKRCAVTAPTGAGKTTLINGTGGDVDCIDIFDVTGNIGVAKLLNAIVIVPFNATNQLYNNLFEISTVKGNQNDIIPEDKACTLVIDQAYKHIKEFEGRYVIIDESHVLFTDRNYRESAAKLLVALNECNCHICCMSATLTGEIEVLGITDIYSKTKDRNKVNVKFIQVDQKKSGAVVMMEMCDPRYDRIVLFSDSYTLKAAEWIINKKTLAPGEVTIMHSRFAGTKQFERLKDTEMLENQYTLCTRLAYNGLNFKNKGERIKIIMDFVPGATLPAEVIQAIGRIRNSKVDAVIVRNDHTPEDVAGGISDAKIISQFKSENNTKHIFEHTYNKKYLDEVIAAASLEIAKYRITHSTVENLEKELNATGYINLKIVEASDDIEKGGIGKVMCKKASSCWIKYIENHNTLPDIDEMDNNMKDWFVENCECGNNEDEVNKEVESSKTIWEKYFMEWNKKVEYIFNKCKNRSIGPNDGFNMHSIVDIYKLSDKQITIPTLLDKISLYLDAISYSEEEWDEEVKVYNTFYEKFKGSEVCNKVAKRWKKMVEYRDTAFAFPNFKLKELNNIINSIDDLYLQPLLILLREDRESIAKRKAEGGKKGGKKVGKKNSKKKVLYNGIKYDSCKALAAAQNVSIQTVSKWIKTGRVSKC